MSYDDICRECEYNVSNDAELCLDCAESKFVDLMREGSVGALKCTAESTLLILYKRWTTTS
jgi:hypothetical protein